MSRRGDDGAVLRRPVRRTLGRAGAPRRLLDPPRSPPAAGCLRAVAGAGAGRPGAARARSSSSPAPGRARPRRWPPGSPGWSPTGWSSPRRPRAHLHPQGRQRAQRAGPAAARRSCASTPTPTIDLRHRLDGEPTVSTYHGYAARAGRRARPADRRRARRSGCSARRCAGQSRRGRRRLDRPMDDVELTPDTVTRRSSALAGELGGAPEQPGRRCALDGAWLDERVAGSPKPRKKGRPGRHRVLARQRRRVRCCRWSRPTRRASAQRGRIDYGDQVASPRGSPSSTAEVGRRERARWQVVLLDEYQDTSVRAAAPAEGAVRRRAPGARRRRPAPVDLRLARCLRRHPRALRPQLPRRRAGPRRAASWPPACATTSGSSTRPPASGRAARGGQDVPRLWPGADRRRAVRSTCALLRDRRGRGRRAGRPARRAAAAAERVAPDGVAWDRRPARPGLQPSDIAVLARKRRSSRASRRRCAARGLPVEVVGLGGLLDVPEVSDVVATLTRAGRPDRRRRAGPAAHRRRAGGSGRATSSRSAAGPARWRARPRRAVRRRARRPSERPPTAAAGGRRADRRARQPRRGARRPGRAARPTRRRGTARLRRLARRAARLLRGTSASRCPTWSTEVARTLGLDIELASAPGPARPRARADLDALHRRRRRVHRLRRADPSLPAFLGYLQAPRSGGVRPGAGRVRSRPTAVSC